MQSYDVRLQRNKGFLWFSGHGMNFKGYLYDNGVFIEGEYAVRYLKETVGESDDPETQIRMLNGVFSFVYENGSSVLACCDRMRSFPLFYYFENDLLVITDEPAQPDLQQEPDDYSIRVFLHTGFVTGEKTLIKNLFQIQAGEYLYSDKSGLKREFYHKLSADKFCSDYEILENEIIEILTGIGNDLCAGLKGRTAVVPLSSGYDSRLIAVLLKMNCFEDVITFTYGRKNNPEIELSRKVADKLGFKWEFIEYNDHTVKDFLGSEDFRSYYPFSAGYTSMFYLQEYFALEQLRSKLPENAVIIPGHSGDTIAGSHICSEVIEPASKEVIVNRIISRHFNMKSVSDKNRSVFSEMLKGSLGDGTPSHLDYENWILKERHGKFIINSNRIYEFFGFGYRMPLVDNRFMDVFTRVDPNLKLGKKLYDSVLKENFFSRYGLNFDNETNPAINEINIQNAKNSIKKIVPKKIIDFYKEKLRINTDIYFNIGVTDKMSEDIKAAGGEPDMSGENRNSIIIQWYIHQLINGRI